MEGIALFLLACVLVSSFSGAEELETRARPGDNIVFYSDCVWKSGFYVTWFRNSSSGNQPPLTLTATDLVNGVYSQYSSEWNPWNKTYDLLVKNISEFELGVYYCALGEKRITEDETGYGVLKDVYHYGSRAFRLSLEDNTVPQINLCLCESCWDLMVIVPVCVLLSSFLSSICVYCICGKSPKGSEERREFLTANVFQGDCIKEHQCEQTMKGVLCLHTEVYYTLLKSE
ncbi:uncharacterized protein [Hoplias malabaricus]|uniref:uncharacterized protein n=1 Tax=Hoplias malabaricus TaxID=27720 RepID=UPI00346247C1